MNMPENCAWRALESGFQIPPRIRSMARADEEGEGEEKISSETVRGSWRAALKDWRMVWRVEERPEKEVRPSEPSTLPWVKWLLEEWDSEGNKRGEEEKEELDSSSRGREGG
jgi:hypothetical protein